MNIHLRNFGRFGNFIALDTASGNYRFFRSAEDPPRLCGHASVEPLWGFPCLFALYSENEKVWLQVDRKRRDVTDGVVSSRWKNFGHAFSRLDVEFTRGESCHYFLMHPLRTLAPLLDPTYDYMDLESDHFFLFLHNYLSRREKLQQMAGLPEKLPPD